MKIPFYNVKRIYASHREEILRITESVFSGGRVIEGKEVESLEDALKLLCNRKHAIALNSCTDALYFSLLAAGVGKGDEVIVPALTFVASATPVVRTGAKVVFADTLPDGNIDLKDAAKKVSSKTKAIIPVHLYGKMLNPDDLKTFAQNNNVIIIEDAAQALGSRYGKTPAGNTGLCSCFSFDPSKIIGAFGTGGAVLCDDDEIAEKIKSWRSQGKNNNSGLFDSPGYNSRLSSLQAALISMQINDLEEIIVKRNNIATEYNSHLKGLNLELPEIPGKENICNFHKYYIKTPLRNKLKDFLSEKGIESAVHYSYLLPEQPVFGNITETFHVAEKITQNALSLPIYPELSNDETNYICNSIKEFFNTQIK